MILAFDTSHQTSAMALVAKGRLWAARSLAMQRGQLETLMARIDGLLGDMNVAYPDLKAIAVTLGPGSFTGVRTGIATAQGLSLALGCPLLGINSLAAVHLAMTKPATQDGCWSLVAQDARRQQLYWQLFDAGGSALTQPAADTADAIARQLPDGPGMVAGDAAPVMRAILNRRDLVYLPVRHCDVINLARWAERQIQDEQQASGPVTLSPIYVRAPDAKLPTPSNNATQPA